MEGVAFHIRWILEAMQAIGLKVETLNAIGGGSTSSVWTQILSDITGRPLNVVENPQEAGAIGAALTVAVGMGVYRNMEETDDLIRILRVVRPIEDRRGARYDELYREYRALYDALTPIYRRLSSIGLEPME